MNTEHHAVTKRIAREMRENSWPVLVALEKAFEAGLNYRRSTGNIGLTGKQRQLLTFIVEHLEAHDGVAPSYDQMKDAMGLRSKSGIHRLINSLEERGFIERMPHRARAIGLLKRAA